MLFQNEWDATVLETHQLRQSLHTTRQELSHALYQHDAATRVVARLLREKETLRQQLEAAAAAATATATGNGGGVAGKRGAVDVPAAAIDAPSTKKPRGEVAATAAAATAVVGGGLPSQIVAEITKKGDDMQIYRKKRVISSTVATPDQLSSQLKLSSTAPLHQTSKGGINAIAVSTYISPPSSPDDNNNSVPVLVATAGNDATVRVYEPSSGRELTSLRGHSKKVLSTSFLGNNQTNIIITGAADGTSRIWQQEDGGGGKYECAHTFQHGTGTGVSVVATPVHATGNYYLSAGSDGHLCYNDIQQRQELVNITACDDGGGLTSAAFHPDGVIFGLGDSSSVVKIYDARSLQLALTMTEHSNNNNKGGVTSLSFSENGYLLASAASDSVKVWDLRKGTAAKQTLDAASVVSFDYSGLYLAAAGGSSSGLKVYGVKQGWGTVVSVSDEDEGVMGSGKKKGVCAVAWGVDAKTLFLGGLDHNLRILSV